ncbi:SMC-Scp complex subunit ScpB [Rothia nasimurium]|uniref:SMC-Scp complex subunit ScpB n=1 Tax=Rothia nasimurium TaxID=85336 RepID=UPI003BA20D4C
MSNPDYSDDDLKILLAGSWGAEPEETETPELAESDQAPEPEASPDSAQAEGTELPSETAPESEAAVAPTPETPGARPAAPARPKASSQKPVVAASSADLTRVELQPGGVKAAIEAILAVADVPVSVREFAAALIVSERAIETALDELVRDYTGYDDASGTHEPRGFELRQVAGGWRLYAREDFSPWVGRFVVGAQTVKLTRAALETLAVIAYQQPATRAYIAQVRGVSVDAAVRNLLQRGLITETVPDEKGATQYITTDTLLEKLGLNSLDELPALAPYLPEPAEVSSGAVLDITTD